MFRHLSRFISHTLTLILTLGLVAASLSSCTPGIGSYAPQNDGNLPAYHLSAGDKIGLTIYGEPELSGEFIVTPEGFIHLPLIGSIKVLDNTLEQAKHRIVEAYQDGYLIDPDITLALITARPFYILGEVNSPGAYEWAPNLNILKAAAMAGGFTIRANQKSFDLVRGETEHAAGIKAKSRLSTLVQPGDVVYVSERYF